MIRDIYRLFDLHDEPFAIFSPLPPEECLARLLSQTDHPMGVPVDREPNPVTGGVSTEGVILRQSLHLTGWLWSKYRARLDAKIAACKVGPSEEGVYQDGTLIEGRVGLPEWWPWLFLVLVVLYSIVLLDRELEWGDVSWADLALWALAPVGFTLLAFIIAAVGRTFVRGDRAFLLDFVVRQTAGRLLDPSEIDPPELDPPELHPPKSHHRPQ